MTLDEIKDVLIKAKASKSLAFKGAMTCNSEQLEDIIAKAQCYGAIELAAQELLVRNMRKGGKQ
jgi:hypothetical protein